MCLINKAKKLDSVLATFTLAIGACKKAYIALATENSLLLLFETFSLKRTPCIPYPLCFKKDQIKVQALLDFSSEINAMVPNYTASLGLEIK